MNTIRVTISLAALFFLVLSFQNCSKITAKDTEAMSLSKTDGSNDGLGGLDDQTGGGSMTGGSSTTNDDTSVVSMDENDDDIDENDETEVDTQIANCLATKKTQAFDASTLSNVRGDIQLALGSLKVVEDTRGKLVLSGVDQVEQMTSITNVRGKIILCNVDVQTIDNTRGALILVNSTVHALHNHRGNVFKHDSEIQDYSDIRGTIKDIQ